MKKTYFLACFMLICIYANAQIVCPNSIKTSGQSTPSSPIFTVPNGQNGCSESWPPTVIVNGSLTYDYISCSGGNLKYEIQNGQTSPSGYNISIDFGSGVVCNYDASGNLIVLSLNDRQESIASVNVNRAKGLLTIDSKLGNTIKRADLYSISGKLVFNISDNEMDISSLKPGLYILKVNTLKGIVVKKIVI